MKITLLVTALLGLNAVADAAVARKSPFSRALHRRQFGGDNNNQDNNQGGNQNGGGGDGSTTLSDTAIQTGSQSDGQADAEAGQSPSAT